MGPILAKVKAAAAAWAATAAATIVVDAANWFDSVGERVATNQVLVAAAIPVVVAWAAKESRPLLDRYFGHSYHPADDVHGEPAADVDTGDLVTPEPDPVTRSDETFTIQPMPPVETADPVDVPDDLPTDVTPERCPYCGRTLT